MASLLEGEIHSCNKAASRRAEVGDFFILRVVDVAALEVKNSTFTCMVFYSGIHQDEVTGVTSTCAIGLRADVLILTDIPRVRVEAQALCRFPCRAC